MEILTKSEIKKISSKYVDALMNIATEFYTPEQVKMSTKRFYWINNLFFLSK